MIDNFQTISDYIKGKTNIGDFYFLQILKRRKDNPDLDADMILLDNFFIKDETDLLKKRERIIELCEMNNARAYFRLNKRSSKKVALQTLRLIADNIASDNYDIKNCYLSCCGQYASDENKTWIIDLDGETTPSPLMMAFIDYECDPIAKVVNDGKCIMTIPTKNGIHLITKPFNISKFRQKYPDIDIHKDNPTILYCK
jgi:hypothetical protein